MAKSQLVTVTENGAGAAVVTHKDASMVDLFTTVISNNSAVTGGYGLIQRAILLAGGMSIQSKLKSKTFNFLK